uniref:NAC domain-containing protein n=1 Tax=Oryza meridionalis TaxID=40149 RepID=A0A0E0D919_9ORYZ
MADDDEIALEPGYVFHPSDDGLITLFLRPSITKVPFEDRLINRADVYSADPAELVGEHRPAPGTHGSSSVWYFFCSPRFTSKRKTSGRRQRIAGGESVWKSEGGKKAVIGADGRRVGYLQKFSYGVYESPSSGSARTFTRLGWCMTEYGLDDDAIDGADKQVLCKVYRSPRAVCAEARTAAAAAKSAYSPRSGSKRKADDGADHPEAPPSARPRQEEAGSEHDEQPAILPELDLDALLSAPMDDNLGVEFDTATTEQYMRYLMNDEPLPWAPTMEAVDGVAGGGDEFIETTNGPCMGEEEIIQRLAAGEILDDILGTNPNEASF